MAFPAGVITRNVTFSAPVGAEDGQTQEVRAIVACNDKLVHLPTGVHLISSPEIHDSGFSLPVTDQDEIWGDGEGNYYTGGNGYNTHSYRVDLEFKDDQEVWRTLRVIEYLLISTGPSDVDLDLVFNPKGLGRTIYDGS